MENGSRITYISGQPKSLTSVKASQDEMIHLQSYSPTVIQDIGRIVHTAITQAMVTHLTSRLWPEAPLMLKETQIKLKNNEMLV